MKRIVLVFVAVFLMAAAGYAQSAREVLDKCAAAISSPDGVQASFRMNSTQYGNAAGTVCVKGKMFYASTADVKMWFDGKTLWTYVAKNDEVNVSNPTEAQLQALNPYNFINLYKDGYTPTMTTGAGSYMIHLKATNSQRKIQELDVTVNSRSYLPTEVKMKQGTKESTFVVSDLKQVKLGDATFRFDKSAYPDAEIIDLR